jgi:hypothetical protein
MPFFKSGRQRYRHPVYWQSFFPKNIVLLFALARKKCLKLATDKRFSFFKKFKQ